MKNFNPAQLRRKSIRLKGYDYSQKGAYFITICTQSRKCLFGNIVDGKMVLSKIGEIIANEWSNTPELRPNIELDEFVVMPNHIHGIVVITEPARRRGVLQYAPSLACRNTMVLFQFNNPSFGYSFSSYIPQRR